METEQPGSKTINKTGGQTGGEAGIRTLDTAFGPYNGLANRRLQPLGHLTADLQVYGAQALTDPANFSAEANFEGVFLKNRRLPLKP